jgi:hypothetical protein
MHWATSGRELSQLDDGANGKTSDPAIFGDRVRATERKAWRQGEREEAKATGEGEGTVMS